MSDPATGSQVCGPCGSITSTLENINLIASDHATGSLDVNRNLDQIAESKAQCSLCQVIWKQIHENYKVQNLTSELESSFILRVSLEEDRQPRSNLRSWADIEKIVMKAQLKGVDDVYIETFDVYAPPDDISTAYIGRILPGTVVNSPEAFHMARAWLNECVANHKDCPRTAEGPLPTRVINVCPGSGLEDIHLQATGGEKAVYAALSYCWGGPVPTMTTTDNIEAHQQALQFIDLPKTIQDAIIVTRELGIAFLWIDALCIIQNSIQDKEQEIDKMGGIYKNAYVTIAAASAFKSTEGFLENKTLPPNSQRFLLPYACPEGNLGNIVLEAKNHSDSLHSNEPIFQRGWCFQERVLSARTLIYSKRGFGLECQTKQFRNGGPEHQWQPYYNWEPNNPIFKPCSTELPSSFAWTKLIERYVPRKLTEPLDKLTAVAGVAAEFSKVFAGDEYLAGWWRSSLREGLTWSVRVNPHPRPEMYRAPSWSWASVDGTLSWSTSDRLGGYPHDALTVVSCRVDKAPMGRVSGGELVLHGRFFIAVWKGGTLQFSQSEAFNRDAYNSTWQDATGEKELYDLAMDVICLWISSSQGMILRIEAPRVYRRWGWFRFRDNHFDACESMTVTII